MTKELLIDAVGYLDESYLADFHQMDVALVNQKNVRKRKSFRAILISAAAIMLVIAMLTVSLPVAYIANYQKVNAYVSEAVDRALFPLDSEDGDVKVEDLAINWVEWKAAGKLFEALGAGSDDSVIDALKNSQGGLAGEMLDDLGTFLDKMYQYYQKHKDDTDDTIGEQGSESETEEETDIDPSYDVDGSKGLRYKKNSKGDGYMISGIGQCTDTVIIVPTRYKDMPVTEIYQKAFLNCAEIESVILHEGIVAIGEQAFSGCSSLGEMVLPDELTTIGKQAFYQCTSMTDIKLSASLEMIG
ncbi:MAG: leucine-rich repeat domain-containing protein, partial [Clostridia bacterium]|nr:leucine-rich repeat domain-containing protein [Clostridia bacterium]